MSEAGRRRATRAALLIAGLLLFGAGLALACWGVYSVTRIGTCASGGPYVSARPCPEGTGTKALAIVAGTFIGLAGLACAIAAGVRRGGPGRSAIGVLTVMWSLTFLGLAGACALAAFGPDAQPDNDGARIAAIVLLVVFVPRALIPLIGLPLLSRSSRREREGQAAQAVPLGAPSTARRASPTTPVVPLGPGLPAPARDPVDQLERLTRLRDAGAIDAREFERLKAQIIGA